MERGFLCERTKPVVRSHGGSALLSRVSMEVRAALGTSLYELALIRAGSRSFKKALLADSPAGTWRVEGEQLSLGSGWGSEAALASGRSAAAAAADDDASGSLPSPGTLERRVVDLWCNAMKQLTTGQPTRSVNIADVNAIVHPSLSDSEVRTVLTDHETTDLARFVLTMAPTWFELDPTSPSHVRFSRDSPPPTAGLPSDSLGTDARTVTLSSGRSSVTASSAYGTAIAAWPAAREGDDLIASSVANLALDEGAASSPSGPATVPEIRAKVGRRLSLELCRTEGCSMLLAQLGAAVKSAVTPNEWSRLLAAERTKKMTAVFTHMGAGLLSVEPHYRTGAVSVTSTRDRLGELVRRLDHEAEMAAVRAVSAPQVRPLDLSSGKLFTSAEEMGIHGVRFSAGADKAEALLLAATLRVMSSMEPLSDGSRRGDAGDIGNGVIQLVGRQAFAIGSRRFKLGELVRRLGSPHLVVMPREGRAEVEDLVLPAPGRALEGRHGGAAGDAESVAGSSMVHGSWGGGASQAGDTRMDVWADGPGHARAVGPPVVEAGEETGHDTGASPGDDLGYEIPSPYSPEVQGTAGEAYRADTSEARDAAPLMVPGWVAPAPAPTPSTLSAEALHAAPFVPTQAWSSSGPTPAVSSSSHEALGPPTGATPPVSAAFCLPTSDATPGPPAFGLPTGATPPATALSEAEEDYLDQLLGRLTRLSRRSPSGGWVPATTLAAAKPPPEGVGLDILELLVRHSQENVQVRTDPSGVFLRRRG